jgi:hypothetical protein
MPSDQIIKDQDVLENFTSWFNEKFVKDEHFNPKEVADQLLRASNTMNNLSNGSNKFLYNQS